MTDLELIKTAIEARKRAYAPYSGFFVGAALLTADGRVFTGCNIENAAFTPTNCAERTAFFKAVSEGVRAFEAIAVVGGKGEEPSEFCAPCGVCRQVMAEFCSPDFRIVLGNEKNQTVYTLSELLPASFSKSDL
jgi:cytidine deaminase